MPHPPSIRPIGTPFIELQSVDSTNNYARALIHAGTAQHGTVIFAHEQLAGKGQRGKIWRSDKDANIIISVLIKPGQLQLGQQFQLSACTAVSLHDFFSNYAGGDTKIKWPNDLYWQDRKAGGILIESIIRSEVSGAAAWDWSIAGIGININQTAFPSFLPNPVSLRQITGKSFDPVILAKELCEILDSNLTALMAEGFDKTYVRYLSLLYKKDMPVKLKKENRAFEATIKAVSLSGKLVVQHATEEEFDFGDVEWIV